jgi:Domain of unknown function (DUF4387)
MTALTDGAIVIKSGNAGASALTFDIEFPDAASRDAAVERGLADPSYLASVLGTVKENVQVFLIDVLHAIKITVPRADFRCGQRERDFDGVQQIALLLLANGQSS